MGAYEAGLSFRDVLGRVAPVVKDAALNALVPTRPLAQIAGPSIHDFLSAAVFGRQNSVTTKLPEARPVAAKQPAKSAANGSAASQAPTGAPTFDQMMQAYAGANGGKISLREMSALADIAAKTTAPHHVPTIADIAGQRALDLGDQLTNYKLEAAKKSNNKDAYAQAAQDQLDRYERIARARAIDPLTAAALEGN